MPEMTSTHRPRKRAIGAVLAIALTSTIVGLAASAPAFGTDMDNPNDAPFWSELYGADCEKYDPPGTINDQGYLTEDGQAVILYEGDWVVLIVKSGSEDVGHGDGNAVYENPVAGTAYYGPLNNGGQQGTVSHWIVCGDSTPTPLVASASVSETPATCDVGERLVYGTFINATPSGTADGTTGPASYEVVATRTTTATFLPGAGVSEDGTTQTFTGTLSGPLDPNDYPDCRGDVPPDDLTFSDGEPYWECTPGVLRPAEISFVRSHFVATAFWNGTAYEYGEPEFDYDEVITIPTPENFDATCPPTVIDEPSSSGVDACGTKDDTFTPYPAGEHYTVLNTDGRGNNGVGTATSTATADVGYTFGTLEAPVASLVNSQEFTDGSCGLALTGVKNVDDLLTWAVVASWFIGLGATIMLGVRFGWFSMLLGLIRRRIMGIATPTA